MAKKALWSKMEPKFRKGGTVEFKDFGKRFVGNVEVIDWIPPKGFRYDVMVYKPKRVFYKHIFEDDLKKAKKI